MQHKIVDTFWVRIYLSGPLNVIEQTCRQYCKDSGLCVTVTPTKFIYTGGEEAGVEVGLINYPRFPEDPESLVTVARELAEQLRVAACQDSVLIMTADKTIWRTERGESHG